MASEFILQTSGLTKEFKGFTAVDNVDIRVKRGHIHALIGPNGAGKTTFFNLLTKFLSPSSGTVHFDGVDVTRVDSARMAQMGAIRSFQISAVFPDLSVLANVRLALQQKAGGSYAFWRSRKALECLNDRAHHFLEQVGLESSASQRACDLPYGSKRALELCTTMAMEPNLMLLDEPTQGMGREDVGRMTELIQRVAAGRTVLMVEHNMGVVSDISDMITVLQRGKILAEGPYSVIANDSRVLEAYMGTTGKQLPGAH